MKKLMRNIALLLLPILVYYAIFIVFEPNNYFGVQKHQPSGSGIGVMRAYQKNPTTSVILGDSRVAHFDMELVESIAGRPFTNLAYGGASLRENLDMLDWVINQNPDVDEILFSTSFYTMNKNYTSDRFNALKNSLGNPFVYITNLSYNLLAMQNVGLFLQGVPLGGGNQEIREIDEYIYEGEDGKTLPYPQFFIDYSKNDLSTYTDKWELDEEDLQSLLNAIANCADRGIKFTVVMPPLHQSVIDLILLPEGISTKMQPVLQRLHESSALVLSYEFENWLDFNDTQYYDGFHLEYNRGLPLWTEILFTTINENQR